VTTFNLAPRWALWTAGGLALANVVVISVSAVSIGALRKTPPASRLWHFVNYIASTAAPVGDYPYARSFNSAY
jgi:hypothetical protein